MVYKPRARKTASKKKYTPKSKPAIKKIVKKEVKSQMAKTQEVKQVTTIISDLQGGNYAQLKPFIQDTGCNIASLTESIDTIGQGTGQGDRIGNRVHMKYLGFKGYLYAINNTLTGGNPTNVTMYIGRLKAGVSTPTTSSLSQFLQLGNTTIAPTDDNRAALYEINRDLWNVYYRKTFKIGGATSTSSNAIPANNDYHVMRKFNINLTKWIPKTINYTDGNNIATNCGLYVWFTIANYNDQVISAGYAPQVQYVGINTFKYTDD